MTRDEVNTPRFHSNREALIPSDASPLHACNVCKTYPATGHAIASVRQINSRTHFTGLPLKGCFQPVTASLCKIPQLLLFPFFVFLSFLFAGIIICEILKFVNYLLDKEDLSIDQPCIAGVVGAV